MIKNKKIYSNKRNKIFRTQNTRTTRDQSVKTTKFLVIGLTGMLAIFSLFYSLQITGQTVAGFKKQVLTNQLAKLEEENKSLKLTTAEIKETNQERCGEMVKIDKIDYLVVGGASVAVLK